MSETDKETKNVETPNNEGVDLQRWVIPQFVYLRSVSVNGTKGYIQTAEPYCDRHIRETKEICKDDIILVGDNINKNPCILCIIEV